eukprot:EG_transcript_6806
MEVPVQAQKPATRSDADNSTRESSGEEFLLFSGEGLLPSPPAAGDRGHWSEFDSPLPSSAGPRLPPLRPGAWGWGPYGQAHWQPVQYPAGYWPPVGMPGYEGPYYPQQWPQWLYGSPPPYPGYPQGHPHHYPAQPRHSAMEAVPAHHTAGDATTPPRGAHADPEPRPSLRAADARAAELWGADDGGAISDTSAAESPHRSDAGRAVFPPPCPTPWPRPPAQPQPLPAPQPRTPENKGRPPPLPRTVRQRVQGILNRITPASYPRLQEELVQLADGLEGPALEEALAEMARCIHQHAINAPLPSESYNELYAALCFAVHTAEQRRLADGLQTGQRVVTFRRVLLDACQRLLESPPQRPTDFNTLSSERQLVEEEKLKVQRMGNVRLVAQLFLHGIISQRLMQLILQKVLPGTVANAEHRPPEQQVVQACTLLDAVSHALDPVTQATLYRRLELLWEGSEGHLKFRLEESLRRRTMCLTANAVPHLARSA